MTGQLNCIWASVEDAAVTVGDLAKTPLHHAFAAHLELVSKALRDIEHVFGDGYENEADDSIRAVISPTAELEAATKLANDAYAALGAILQRQEAPEPNDGGHGYINEVDALRTKLKMLIAQCKINVLPHPDVNPDGMMFKEDIISAINECESAILCGF